MSIILTYNDQISAKNIIQKKVMPLLVSQPPFLMIQTPVTLYKNDIKSNIENLLTKTLDNASKTCF